MNPIIGVDFDNTIINYDELMYNLALERGLIDSHIKKQKKSIRDQIRSLPEGEKAWQHLQASVYGHKIREAQLIAGVDFFFRIVIN